MQAGIVMDEKSPCWICYRP